MTLDELQIQLDIHSGNEIEVLKQHARKIDNGYLFVDSTNGQCYLFDRHGKQDNISKIESIENWTFDNCKSLNSIIIPDSVKSIGDYAFVYCTSLESITIPDSVESIGNGAFYNCTSLKSITISDSVESIRDKAFYWCTSLKSIIIPDSVESIGDGAFWNCASLNEVIFKGKTIDQVNAMANYPWDIKDISIIKCQMS